MTRAALLALLLAGCTSIHPSAWEPYDPAQEWSCEQEAWSRSVWTWIDDRYIDRDVYEDCMRGKGFTKAQRVWAR